MGVDSGGSAAILGEDGGLKFEDGGHRPYL